MPANSRPQRLPTDDWAKLGLFVTSLEQKTIDLLRPIVLFGQPIPRRARETGVPKRPPRRRVARFAARGRRSLFAALADPAEDRRRLPAEVRRASSPLRPSILAAGCARSPRSARSASR
jgi:hypothetical protein